MVAKLSSVRIMLAASFATSVPRIPIAMPMWASLSAGASFMPSPVTATTSPFSLSSLTKRSLSSGVTRAKTNVFFNASFKSASVIFAISLPVNTFAAVYADLAGDCSCSFGVVACNHDYFDSCFLAGFDGASYFFAWRVDEADNANKNDVSLKIFFCRIGG